MRWARLALLLGARSVLGGADLIAPGKRCHQVSGTCRPSQGAAVRPDVEPPPPKPAPRRLELGDDAPSAEDPCAKYLSEEDCSWTLDYGCPGQPTGAQGDAEDDGTDGFLCCCTKEAWKQLDSPPLDSPPLVEENPCGSGEAVDDSISCGLGYVDGSWSPQVCCVPDGTAEASSTAAATEVGGQGSLPPWWVLHGVKPAGQKDQGSWKSVAFSEEQQQQFGVDETGEVVDQARFDEAMEELTASTTAAAKARTFTSAPFSTTTASVVDGEDEDTTLPVDDLRGLRSDFEDKTQAFGGTLFGGRGKNMKRGSNLIEVPCLVGAALLTAALAGRLGPRCMRARDADADADADEAQTAMLHAGSSGEGL